jgi:hypothetical protein
MVASAKQSRAQNLPAVSWTQASVSSPQSSSVAQVSQKVSTAGMHTRRSKPSTEMVWQAKPSGQSKSQNVEQVPSGPPPGGM